MGPLVHSRGHSGESAPHTSERHHVDACKTEGPEERICYPKLANLREANGGAAPMPQLYHCCCLRPGQACCQGQRRKREPHGKCVLHCNSGGGPFEAV